MKNIFPNFTPNPNLYPGISPNVKISTPSFPTNSWAENAIRDNIVNDTDRHCNAIPWYVIPVYTANKLSFSHTGSVNFTNDITTGDLRIQETPSSYLNINYDNLNLTNIDDFTLTFSNNDRSINNYVCRGSPFINTEYTNKNVDLSFEIPNITNFEKINGSTYQINTSISSETIFSVSLNVNNVSVPGDTDYVELTTNDAYFYDGPIQSAEQVEISYKYQVESNIVVATLNTVVSIFDNNVSIFNPDNITVNVNIPPPDITGSYNPIITYIKNNITYIVRIDANPASDPRKIFLSKIVSNIYKWYIFTNANLQRIGNGVSTTSPFTGLLQVAFAGKEQTLWGEYLAFYSQYIGSYIKSGQTSDFTITDSSNFTFKVIFDRIGVNVPIMLPNHWNTLNLNISKINFVAGNNLIYGNLTYYNVNNNINAAITGYTLPLLPGLEYTNGTIFSPEDIQQLKSMSTDDAGYMLQYNVVPIGSNPYNFGTAATSASRILTFYKLITSENNVDINNLNKNLTENLNNWLTGNNPGGPTGPADLYQLQYDNIWKGIVVPADYIDKNVSRGVGSSYGNTYYNDHHFQWGYLLSSIYYMQYFNPGYLNQSASFNGNNYTFKDKAIALVKDYCNFISDDFSWKTRHKDWYAGHSWATGITEEVNRQQESSGEAINGYYAAYILMGVITSMVGGNTPENISLRNCAAICCILEILSSNQYYKFQAPGTHDMGIFRRVNSLGLIQSEGKSFTLDFAMEPNTYPGRAIGMYGIQSISFNEVSQYNIPSEWINRISTPVDNYNEYAMTNTLISGLNDNSYQEIAPSSGQPRQEIPFNVYKQGSYWGSIGLCMMSFSNVMPIADMQSAFNDSLNKIAGSGPRLDYYPLKSFLSFTNLKYFMIKYGKYINLGKRNDTYNLSTPEGISIKLSKNGGTSTAQSTVIYDDAEENPIVLRYKVSGDLTGTMGNDPCKGNCLKCCQALPEADMYENGFTTITVVISEFKLYIKGDDTLTFFDKCNILLVDPDDILFYATLKLLLMRINTGKICYSYLLGKNSHDVKTIIKCDTPQEYRNLIKNLDNFYQQYFKYKL